MSWKLFVKRLIGEEQWDRLAVVKRTLIVALNRLRRAGRRNDRYRYAIPIQTYFNPDSHTFFGYYDVCQLNSDQTLLLASQAPLIHSTPGAEDYLRLCVYDFNNGQNRYEEFALTNTWCWQQGCRLQWYPSSSNDTVLYNKLVNGECGSVVHNLKKQAIVRTYDRPIYSVSHDGSWGLSLNFGRLQRLRPGYGYSVCGDATVNERCPENDGIWRIEMSSGRTELLFSIKEIAEHVTINLSCDANQYVNHLQFNPAGTHFVFFHIAEIGQMSRVISLFCSDISGGDLRLINGGGHSSHFCWKDDNTLLCYSTWEDKGTGYFLYHLGHSSAQKVGADCLGEDGHPSYLPDKERLITDTYPNRFGEQSLLLFDFTQENLLVLDELYSPPRFVGETRCDLHPRVSASGRYVSIDCVIQGQRGMRVYEIPSTDEFK